MPPRKTNQIDGLSWDRVELAPLILIRGPETVLAERALARLRSQARHVDPDYEYVEIDAAAYAPHQLSQLTSPSLFGERRFIVFNGSEHMNDAFAADIHNYCSQPEEDCWVVVCYSKGQRGKKVLDALAKHSPVVACNAITSDGEKASFVAAEFARARRRIEKAAVIALVEAVGSDIAELAASCAQLLTDTSGLVTAEVVRRYYGNRVEATAFEVANTIVVGQLAQSLTLLRHALDTGVAPAPIVGAVAAKLRTLIKVGANRGGGPQQLGMPMWQIRQARESLRGWTLEGLGKALSAVAEADEGVKGGAKDPIYALEKMLLTIASARPARRQ